MNVSKSDIYVENGLLQIDISHIVRKNTSDKIWASIQEDKDLLIYGHNLGPGGHDYEYWTIVKAKDKHIIYDALVAESFDLETSYAHWIDDMGIDVTNEFETALLCLMKHSGKGRNVQGFAYWAKEIGADVSISVEK